MSLEDVHTPNIWREIPLRYLGYANEVGESFRFIFPRFLVPSYGLTTLYILGDAASAFKSTYEKTDHPKKSVYDAMDTFVWQFFASCLIPGLTIRGVVSSTHSLLNASFFTKTFQGKTWLSSLQKRGPMAIGLLAIPVIIHPIDMLVNWTMEREVRTCSYCSIKRPNKWTVQDQENETKI